jgi:hydrogenase nickel incorporation protein HypB
VVLVNKIDLLPYLSFSVAALEESVRKVNRRAEILKVSATSGEGLANWYGWLAARRAALMA